VDNTLTSKELMRRVRAGPQQQAPTPGAASTSDEFELLFARLEPRLGRFLNQLVRSRALAEDLLQDTFLAAYEARTSISDPANLEAWLFAIARNRALSALRSRRRAAAAFDRVRRRLPRVTSDGSEATAIRDLLAQCLEPEEQALVLLRYLHGFSAVELAAMTGRSPDAVRQQLARARARVLKAADEGRW
jgi:RNA polymerase sigma-70 factor, ECF subfamily